MKDAEIVITTRAGKVVKVSVTTTSTHSGTFRAQRSELNENPDLRIDVDIFDAAPEQSLEAGSEPPAETVQESGAEWHRYEDLFPEPFESEYHELLRPTESSTNPGR